MAISRNILIGAVMLLLVGIGGAAWVHSSQASAAPAAVTYAAPNNQPAVSSATDGYYPSVPAPVYVRQGQEPPAPLEPVYQPNPAPAPRYRGTYYTTRRRHHGRSKKHSVEIVAGTAAAGAAIGAIAGGGPGAAIGAISGGGAGFVYDRLTHNH